MALFRSHTLETAPAEVRPLLEETVHEVGFLPNLDAQLAEVPAVLQAYSWLGDQFDRTSLSAIERQVVLLAVSVENGDEFSVAAHSYIARDSVGLDDCCIGELRQGRPLSDPRLDALATFTREIVRSRGRAHDMPLAAFLGAGFTLKQALEVLLGVTLITMSAYASRLMNTSINAQLDPDRWHRPGQGASCSGRRMQFPAWIATVPTGIWPPRAESCRRPMHGLTSSASSAIIVEIGMSHSSRVPRLVLLALASLVAVPCLAAAPVTDVRLYAFDCGRMQIKDMGMFSDTGEYDGKPGVVADPCFVIRHPKGTLLWDTGLPDKLAASKGGVDMEAGHQQRDATLIDELKGIGLTPADITYLSFSHTHFDHTGNANEFPDATWILNKAEIAWAETRPGWAVDLDSFSAYKTAKTQMIDGDYDVFGDHSVMILKTPGHTPGHQSLEVRLKKSGVVILSGDLWHLRDNYRFRRVPGFNTERADTLASMDRINALLKNTKGRLVIQHDAGDFGKLPKAPQYLD